DIRPFPFSRAFYGGRTPQELRQIAQLLNVLELTVALNDGEMEPGQRRHPLLEGTDIDLRHKLAVVRQNGGGLDAGRNSLLPIGSHCVQVDTFTQTPAHAGFRAYNLSEPGPEWTVGQSGVISRRRCLLNAKHGSVFKR